MNLTEYIASVGDRAFSRKIGVTERAAMAYRLRERTPRRDIAKRIVERTPVTWEGIYAQGKRS